MPGSTQPPEPSLHPSHAQLDASPARRKAVHFSASPAGKASPTRASKAALDGGAGGARCSPQKASLLVRQGSWTIEAQRTDRMEALNSSSPPPAASEASPLPSLLLSGGAGSVGAMTSSPASVGYLESARKAEELRGRLERLEAALREMESKAVAHLDKSLQDKVLTTAAKIVQKRFLADKELDKKLQHQILQTAIKVVNKRQAAGSAPRQQQLVQQQEQQPKRAGEEADPTRRLEFDQGEAGVAAVVAHIEAGLGEVLRRLEKKVEAVAGLMDQNAMELLEAHLAGGLLKLEGRLAAVEEAAAAGVPQQRGQQSDDASSRLLERVGAVEAAMVEQSRAVSDLLAALGTQHGSAALQQAAAAAMAAQAAAKPADAQAQAHAQAQGGQQPASAAGQHAVLAAKPRGAVQEADTPAAPPVHKQAGAPEPAAQLVQRKAAVARRSMLADPARAAGSAATTPRAPALPRLKPAHAAGTAQQIAMATARQQLARQAAERAREEAEAEGPAWLAALYVFGWGLVALLGLGALLIGIVAAMLKSGRLNESDLAFLWEPPARR
ncbi:expressed protein isoform A [Micractinium conductrix]|uniref:Expressed protein isoform A n=1 Tax=Micractinium conductrix TaxID=554055 RepID=A0A2P6VDQ5_9CHLO|nr:expressed protein isoform A [Micractinium conductrix]|eukprot:PSC72223.1 expressed protein isoform A [Micractinium conductrix]